MKLLFAEDTKDLNRVITQMLTMQGYDVDSALDGRQALDLALKNGYDGMILDIMMPEMSGLEVLSEIRKHHIITPVLLLTAKSEVDDRVAGLDAGADDYLTKPFAMKELLARVRALTRRTHEYSQDEMHFGDIRLNAGSLELTAENTVRLSMKECELMQALISDPDHVVDSAFLLDHVWHDDENADDSTVWLYINFLRDKLRYIDSHLDIDGKEGGPFTLKERREE